MSSALLMQQEGFSRYPNSIRTVMEQKTPSLVPLSRSPTVSGRLQASVKAQETVIVQEGEDVESVMIAAGLTPNERIMSLSKEGHKYIRYSKCSDENGNVCLIEHDGFGHIVGENVTTDLYEEQEATIVISSLKNQVCDMSKKHGCTMSISSGSGYYVANYALEVKKEAYFSKIHHQCQKGQVCEVGTVLEADIEVDKVMIIPVFKFSDLKTQKEVIMKKLVDMAFSILCIMNKLAEEKNKEFQCSLNKSVELWKKYVCARDAYVRKIHDKLRKLECLMHEMECNKSLMECNKDKYCELQKKYRHTISDYAKYNAILLSSHKLAEHAKEIETILGDNLCKMEALDKCC